MRISTLPVAAAATLLLAACGSSPLEGKTGPEVVTAAADALEAADAVHIAGTVEQQGEAGEVDLHLQGEDATGTITFAGVELGLLIVDGVVHVKAAPDFWASFGMPADAAAMFDDRWVVMPEEESGPLATFTLPNLLKDLREPDSPVKDDVTAEEVDGRDVVVVEQEDGGTLTVLDDEKSYPLRIATDGSSDGITFSRFGEEEEISAPDDALDLAEMTGG